MKVIKIKENTDNIKSSKSWVTNETGSNSRKGRVLESVCTYIEIIKVVVVPVVSLRLTF